MPSGPTTCELPPGEGPLPSEGRRTFGQSKVAYPSTQAKLDLWWFADAEVSAEVPEGEAIAPMMARPPELAGEMMKPADRRPLLRSRATATIQTAAYRNRLLNKQ